MAKRRANGEGSIRKRKDGRWEGRYTAGYDENGKRIMKNVLGKTQAEVKTKLREASTRAETVQTVLSDKYTLAQWLRHWLDEYGQVYLRPSSQVNYEGFLKNQITSDSIGKMKLQKLTEHDLQLFYNRMSKSGRVQRKGTEKKPEGLAAKSIRNMHFFISHALAQAVKEKLIPENPARDCILPRKEKTEMKTLPLDKLEAFFAEAKRTGVFELYYTELSTGLRRGELLGIRWEDIDFNAGSIYIQRQINPRDGVEVDYGFATKEERELFRQITSVSGMGAASARMVLSSLSAEELRNAILSEDVNRLKGVKGIGLKTAQRMVLELKDKIVKGDGAVPDVLFRADSNAAAEEAATALQMLGFAKPNINKAIQAILKQAPQASVEEIIKAALQRL